MQTVTLYDAQTGLSRLLDQVAQGEEFTITRDGVPVAKLSSAQNHEKRRVEEVIEEIQKIAAKNTLGHQLSVKDLIHEGHKY